MYEAEGAFLRPEYQAILKTYALLPYMYKQNYVSNILFLLSGHCRRADFSIHSANVPSSGLYLLGYFQLQALCDHAGWSVLVNVHNMSFG